LCETWSKNDLGIYNFETQVHARDPKRSDNNNSRNSGGIYIGADLPMCKQSGLPGFARTKINNIYFFMI